MNAIRLLVLSIMTVVVSLSPGVMQTASAASAKEIDIKVAAALQRFRRDVDGGATFLENAKGVLVFPSVIKAGFGIGGEYGEGALLIDGKTADYYSTASASIGLQLGAQTKTVFLVFLDRNALNRFRSSDGWKAGVDGSVAVVEFGTGKDINTVTFKDPIVGFIFGNKGLMFNLTLEGSKFSKLVR